MPHDHPAHAHLHPHGHNRQLERVAEWELPRAPGGSPAMAAAVEPDFDLVEASFIDAARNHPDPTSFLRLVNVPFRAALADGRIGYLLGYLIEDVVEVGTVSPGFGGADVTYTVVPASRSRARRHLRFRYWTSRGELSLTLAEARALKA